MATASARWSLHVMNKPNGHWWKHLTRQNAEKAASATPANNNDEESKEDRKQTMKNWKFIILSLTFATTLCSAQNDSTQLGKILAKDTTLLHEAHKDALRDSFVIDNVKSAYMKALELDQLSNIQNSANLKRAAFQAYVGVLNFLEKNGIPYPEYYAASAYHAGNIQFGAGNYGMAYTCFETAHKYSPKNIEYLSHLAYMNEHFNDPLKNHLAIANYKELVKLDPKEPVYHLHLYYLYLNFKNFKQAKKELDTYIHTEGESINAIEPYLSLYDAMNKPKQGVEYLKGFIERNPASRLEGELYLSRYLLRYEQNQAAFHYLIKNLDKIPTHDLPNLLNPYIQTIIESKDIVKVNHFLDTLQSLHNDKLEVFQYSHDVRQSIGDTSGMFPVLQRMYQLGKEDEMVYRSLAEYYIAHDMKDEMYELAIRGDSLFSNEVWTYYHIVSSYDSTNYNKYIPVFEQNKDRITNKMVKSSIYLLLALSYNGLRKECRIDASDERRSLMNKECAAYDSALTYNPENSGALNNYAYNLATSDSATEADLIRAERMAARAVKSDPSATFILDTYAWVLHLRGDDITARIYINKLIRQSESNGDKMSATEYYHIYSILSALNDSKAEHYLKLMRDEYKKNPDSVSNDDKTKEGIEKLL